MSTIVALATPPGIGALHVIRMSGSDAFEIINRISVDRVEKTQDRIQVTFLRSRNNQLLDQVVLSKFYAPYSYTGEDCIEISCHGNGLISKLIVDELIKSGAVAAERGEFTKRAFLNEKIDLNKVLNIKSLFEAKNEVDVYFSVNEIRGATSDFINESLKTLLNLISECELNIDYPPDIDRDDRSFYESMRERILNLRNELGVFLDKSKKQTLSKYRVVFVGKPNAGKSSLVNHLIEREKIIVSDRAGTTQDSIEVDYCFEGYLLTLVDTAGVAKDEEFNDVEAAKKSELEIKGADLIVHLVSCEDRENIDFMKIRLENKPYILLYTKSDLDPEGKFIPSISVKNGNVTVFFDSLREKLKDNYSTTGIRSRDGINHLNNACEMLDRSLDGELTVDLMVEFLHDAYSHLSSIVRLNKSTAEKINNMFDGFCVGK